MVDRLVDPAEIVTVVLGPSLVHVLERLAALEDEFAAVEAELADPAVLADPDRLRRASKRHKDLGAMVSRYREYRSRTDDLDAATRDVGRGDR